jgi:putative oxidoreductase
MNLQPGSSNSHTLVLNLAVLILRIGVGIIMAAHGAQKLGFLGGGGLAQTIGFLGPVGYLVTIGEFLGGLGILLGFLTRFSAFWLIVIQVGAVVKVHWVNGFFLYPKTGFEYNLSLIVILLALLLLGPGQYAIISVLRSVFPGIPKKAILFIE